MIISIADTAASLLASFSMFAIMGHLAHSKGLPISKVVESGHGLAFIVVPAALAKLEYFPRVR